MNMDHRDRDELYRRLSELFGEELAAKFLESLPPMDWTQLATKDDIAALRDAIERCATKEEMRGLREAFDAKHDAIRGEMHGLRAAIDGCATKGELRGLGETVAAQLESIRVELKGFRETSAAGQEARRNEVLATVRGDLVAAIGSQTRTIIFGMAATTATLGAALVAAVRLT